MILQSRTDMVRAIMKDLEDMRPLGPPSPLELRAHPRLELAVPSALVLAAPHLSPLVVAPSLAPNASRRAREW
jgi:hypothetical protein